MPLEYSDGFEEVSPEALRDLPTFKRLLTDEAFFICRHGRFKMTPEYTLYLCGPDEAEHQPPISHAVRL